jgi:hypothetical protein
MAGYTVSSVTAGKYARQISVAASGPQGAQGPTGPEGAIGATGETGGLSAQYKYLNTYVAANPGNGYFAFNAASIFSATQMFISEYDINVASQSGLLDVAVASTSTNTAVVTVQNTTTKKFSRYYITGASIGAGWRTLDIEYIDGTALSWTYNDAMSISVTPIGDRGQIGPTGAQGEVGPGVPAGGTAGQILRKTGVADYETEWVDPQEIEDVSVSELTDVVLTEVGNAQVLVYDELTSKWVNRSTTEVPVSASQISGTIVGGEANTF